MNKIRTYKTYGSALRANNQPKFHIRDEDKDLHVNFIRLANYILIEAFDVFKKYLMNSSRTRHVYKMTSTIYGNLDYYMERTSKQIIGTKAFLEYIKTDNFKKDGSYYKPHIFEPIVKQAISEIEMVLESYKDYEIVTKSKRRQKSVCICGTETYNLSSHLESVTHIRKSQIFDQRTRSPSEIQ